MCLYLVYQTQNILFSVVTWSSSILVEGGVMWYGSTLIFLIIQWRTRKLIGLSFMYPAIALLVFRPRILILVRIALQPTPLWNHPWFIKSNQTTTKWKQNHQFVPSTKFSLSLVMNLFIVCSPWSMAPSCAPYWSSLACILL